jgi:orotidine-5'-phosphate decarboxylase
MSAPGGGLERVAVALDTAERATFRSWVEWFGPRVGVLKVGLEAFVRFGPDAVAEARAAGGRVFLDLKLHDIPNTVAGAVGAARELGVDYLTVHAGGGAAMLEAAVAAAEGAVGILAVTVLTSLDAAELERLALPGTAASRALAWARMAHAAGCAGVVCSAQELATLRPELPRPFRLVTPGIRPSGAGSGDQKRTATPAAALAAGADLLVIGRPLTRADDRNAALAALAAELARTPAV